MGRVPVYKFSIQVPLPGVAGGPPWDDLSFPGGLASGPGTGAMTACGGAGKSMMKSVPCPLRQQDDIKGTSRQPDGPVAGAGNAGTANDALGGGP